MARRISLIFASAPVSWLGSDLVSAGQGSIRLGAGVVLDVGASIGALVLYAPAATGRSAV